MAPPPNADVYAAVKEINTSLMFLRREQDVAKRHMNVIDHLIDEHQTKIDALMQLVMNENEVAQNQTEPSVSTTKSPIPNKQPRLTVSPPLLPQSTSPPLIEQGHRIFKPPVFGQVTKMSPTPSLTSAPLINQGNSYRPVAADRQFIGATPTSMSNGDDIPITWVKQEVPDTSPVKASQIEQENSTVAADQTHAPSTSTALPDDQAPISFSTMRRKALPVLLNELAQPGYRDVLAKRRLDTDGTLYYECCKYRFTSSFYFIQHVLRKHAIKKRFKCDQCSYICTNIRDIRRHKQHVSSVDKK